VGTVLVSMTLGDLRRRSAPIASVVDTTAGFFHADPPDAVICIVAFKAFVLIRDPVWPTDLPPVRRTVIDWR